MTVLCALPAPAIACSCAMDGAAADAMAKSDAVFIGAVTRMRDAAPAQVGGPPRRAVEFVVRKVLKGQVAASQSILSNADDASCGFPFEPDQAYVVYSVSSQDGLATGLCSGTRKLRD